MGIKYVQVLPPPYSLLYFHAPKTPATCTPIHNFSCLSFDQGHRLAWCGRALPLFRIGSVLLALLSSSFVFSSCGAGNSGRWIVQTRAPPADAQRLCVLKIYAPIRKYALGCGDLQERTFCTRSGQRWRLHLLWNSMTYFYWKNYGKSRKSLLTL